MFYSIIQCEIKNTACAHTMVFYFLNEIAVLIVSLLYFVIFFFLHADILYRKWITCTLLRFVYPQLLTISYANVLHYACNVEDE